MNDLTLVPEHENVPLDQIDQIGNSICQSLILQNVLQMISPEQFEVVLSKMRHGGTITIHCIDVLEVAKAVYWGKIDLAKLSSALSGSITYHSVLSVKTFLEQRGYGIQQAQVDTESLSFIIKAKRS